MIKQDLNIIIRFTAKNKIGSGHLFHSLSLFKEFQTKNIHSQLILKDCDDFVYKKLDDMKIKYTVETSNNMFSELFIDKRKNIIINDILDTDEVEIKFLKSLGFKVVNIEDKGTGANFADGVINALYDKSTKNLNELNGPKFTVLREDFKTAKDKLEYSKNKKIVVSFGGTDPANLSEKIYSSIKNSDIPFVIVEPPFRELGIKDSRIVKNIENIAEFFSKAKIGLTSSGRTMHEFIYLGIPIISISQHDRESKHSLNRHEFIEYLGQANELSEERILKSILNLYSNPKKINYLKRNIGKIVDGQGLERIAEFIINI